MRKIMLVVFAALCAWSCQKEEENLENNYDEIKKIEEKLNIKLKEATENDLENAIYIPYEELKAWADGEYQPETISRGDYNLNVTPYLTKSDVSSRRIETSVYGVNIIFKGTSFDFDFHFDTGTNNDWNISGKIDYLYAMARVGSNWFSCYADLLDKAINKYPNYYGFRFKIEINMSTEINGKPYIFKLGLGTNVRVILNTQPSKITVPMDTMIKFSILF